MENQIFIFNGNKITFQFGNGDIMVNVTEFAKAFPNKNLSQIINSKEIKDYISELSAIKNYIATDLLIVENVRGTWAHQRVVLRIVQKLSIRELLSSAENLAVLQMSFESSYKASNGKTNPMYIMNRYGFSCIVKQIKKIFVRIEKFYTFVMQNLHNIFRGKKSHKIIKPVRAVWSGDILYLVYVSSAAYGFLNLKF